jgi:nucleosome binding factor SPN SPT16 subunit
MAKVEEVKTPGGIKVKVLTEKPAIYDRLKERFKTIDWEKGLAIVWGDKIYTKYKLPNHVLAHELVHVRQQLDFEGGVSAWWDEYLTNDQFRLEQELEAYVTQVRYIREHTEESNRNWRRQIIDQLAEDLSSSMYGNLISKGKAKEILKS